MHILACIPAFNEEEIIGELVKRSLLHVNDVVVCDDGSSDNTSNEAEKAGAYVIKHEINMGKGASLKSLFKYARRYRTDIIITIDGDGQFLPEEIPKLCKSIIEDSTDIVVGYRFDDEKDMPSYRKVGNRLLDHVSNLASELPLRDTQSGFRAYSKKSIDKIKFSSAGFAADSEILISASENGLRINETKVTVKYNIGKKTSTKNPISHGSGVLAVIVKLVLIKHPLKFLGIPGIISLIAGLVSSIYVMNIFNEIRYFSVPFGLLSMGFLVLGSMLILVSCLLYAFNRQINKQ